MHIAILTFEGFNELDSLIALGILNRIKRPGWRVSIACPSARVRSMNGVVLDAQASLSEASAADAVIVGSGLMTRDIVQDPAIMGELRLDPAKLVGIKPAEAALHYVAPVGEKEDYVARAMRNVQPYLAPETQAA